MDLGGPVIPARLQFTSSENLSPYIMSSRTWNQRMHAGVEEQHCKFSAGTIEEVDEEGDERSLSM